LNSTFAVVAFFAGGFVNRLGVRLTLAFGGIGYAIYTISLLVYVHKPQDSAFNIFAGAFLGVCAGLLWTAQGTIMLSYPSEGEKGRYFAWFWGIFNVGAVLGSLVCPPLFFCFLVLVGNRPLIDLHDEKIPLAENIHVTTNSAVSDGTYIGFIVLMFCGALLATCLCDAQKVIRSDGSKVVLMKNPSFKSEFYGLWTTLRSEPFIILLFPMFWSSNWFYTYQPNDVNAAVFNTRTRALNGMLYWMAQIVGATLVGHLLDLQQFRRTTRAKAALVALFVITMAVWGGGYAWQKWYTRDTVNIKTNPDWAPWDWTHSGYLGPMFLYFFYGLFDALWQGTIYWYGVFPLSTCIT
jgi:MFS family permease